VRQRIGRETPGDFRQKDRQRPSPLLEHKHGKAKALTVLAHKLGRAVYDMLTREHAFDLQRFVAA
jgi:hypothetical protein